MNLISVLIGLGTLVVAITIHEFAHAYAADRLGDPTPRLQKRLTLNPLAHLDLYGSILYIVLLFSGSPFVIGWGKPVQFDPFNLRNPRRGSAIISLAGPFSNLILAIVGSVILAMLEATNLLTPNLAASILQAFLIQLVVINIRLMIFNLIPFHPLDGFKIVGGFLSEKQAQQWYQLERYGVFFLFALLLTPGLQLIMGPTTIFFLRILLPNLSFV